MTDLTPKPLTPKQERMLREKKPSYVVSQLLAALDAERARRQDAETGLAHQREMKLEWKARYEHLIAAARDLCNSETDTYPALQKALADVDAGQP